MTLPGAFDVITEDPQQADLPERPQSIEFMIVTGILPPCVALCRINDVAIL